MLATFFGSIQYEAKKAPTNTYIVNEKPCVNIKPQQLYMTLNDGNKMPMVGLGTWNAQGKQLKESIITAIDCGYRHIDTASNYRNEALVGEAISECIAAGLCKREDLFITTKLWNNSHRRGSVCRALRKSLEIMQLDYVDLYLIHYPIAYQEGDSLSPIDSRGKLITTDCDYLETWLGMEDARLAGLARSIGVSNFNASQLARLLTDESVQIVPVINQVECHPFLNQHKLSRFCRAHGIGITAYSPLGSPGRLGVHSPRELRLIENEIVVSLAKKYIRPAAQILISYQLKRNIAVIPKAIQSPHIISNLDALTLNLTVDDVSRLDSLNRNYRFQAFERCMDHKYYPFGR